MTIKINDNRKEILREFAVEKILRKHLDSKGWSLTNLPRTVGEHGCDITAWHKKWRRVLLIEVKGGGKAEVQMKHNGFYTLVGQIVARMDIGGNDPKRGRIYAIAIPANWEQTFKNKIKKMEYGWKLLKLKVFLVSEEKVEEKSYTYFLKK